MSIHMFNAEIAKKIGLTEAVLLGSELFNMKDLVCICKECHERHHNIKG